MAAAAAGLHYNLAATLNTPLTPFGAFPFAAAFPPAQFGRFSSGSGGGTAGSGGVRFNHRNPAFDLGFPEALGLGHHPASTAESLLAAYGHHHAAAQAAAAAAAHHPHAPLLNEESLAKLKSAADLTVKSSALNSPPSPKVQEADQGLSSQS
jgi:hypothetical protein